MKTPDELYKEDKIKRDIEIENIKQKLEEKMATIKSHLGGTVVWDESGKTISRVDQDLVKSILNVHSWDCSFYEKQGVDIEGLKHETTTHTFMKVFPAAQIR